MSASGGRALDLGQRLAQQRWQSGRVCSEGCDEVVAHAPAPELVDMVGDRGHGLLVRVGLEELGDLAAHVRELVAFTCQHRFGMRGGRIAYRAHDVWASRSCESVPVKSMAASLRAMLTRVRPRRLARSIARDVGAETETSVPAPKIAAFSTISNEARLVTRTKPSSVPWPARSRAP